MDYFCLLCKNLLERACLSGIAVFFCVARENLRPRHAVIFSMPCAWRGVKIFLNLSMIFQGTAKGYCSAHFLQLQMQMQILSAWHSGSVVAWKSLWKWSEGWLQCVGNQYSIQWRDRGI